MTRLEFPKYYSFPQTPRQEQRPPTSSTNRLQMLRQELAQKHQQQQQQAPTIAFPQFRFPSTVATNSSPSSSQDAQKQKKFSFLISNYCRRLNHVACEEVIANMKAEGVSFDTASIQNILRMYVQARRMKWPPLRRVLTLLVGINNSTSKINSCRPYGWPLTKRLP